MNRNVGGISLKEKLPRFKFNKLSRFVFLYKETNPEQNQANMGGTSC